MHPRSFFPAFFCALLVFSLQACSSSCSNDPDFLCDTAEKINAVFVKARKEIGNLKQISEEIYNNPGHYMGLHDDSRYTFFNNTVYYTPRDDGCCEIWASGLVPVGPRLKAKIKMLEHLCTNLKRVLKSSQAFDDVYLTTYDGIIVNTPYTDVNTYLKPGLDFAKDWVTYWAADKKRNPEGRILWVEPYIDAMGRGYMTSVIAPVYSKGKRLEGTLGIDITVDAVNQCFITPAQRPLMIITNTSIPVACSRMFNQCFNIKGLENYNYLERAAENKYMPGSLSLALSRSPLKRGIAAWLKGNETSLKLNISGKEYLLKRASIAEVNWFLVSLEEL